jgi:hypothetical protein
MKFHFFVHRIQSAIVYSYIDEKTYRVFSFEDPVSKAIPRKKSGKVGDNILDRKLIDLFTKNFDNWYGMNPKPTQGDFDSFQKSQVKLYFEELKSRGVLKRKGNSRFGPFSYNFNDYYNSFAKPYNLLLWHHCLGGPSPPLTYPKDAALIKHLHPALDSFLFEGLRQVLKPLVGVPSAPIPKGGFATLYSEKVYDTILTFYRTHFQKCDIPLIVLESFWLS